MHFFLSFLTKTENIELNGFASAYLNIYETEFFT